MCTLSKRNSLSEIASIISKNIEGKKDALETFLHRNIFRMGSFTSMSKIIPATDADKDIEHEFSQLGDERLVDQKRKEEDKGVCVLDNFLDHCSKRLAGLPEPISRKWKDSTTEINPIANHSNSVRSGIHCKEENIRVLQWNVLSQSKYINNIK